jgi:hydrogenase maturation protease
LKKRIKILVIGIGNEFRSDDAIGIITARKLREYKLKDIDVAENNGDGALLIEQWQGYEKVILIDAVSNNNNPGRVHVIDPINKPLPKELALDSSHLFNVTEAIETARILKRLPCELLIFGIEGKSFAAGTEMTNEVLSASGEVVTRIKKEIGFSKTENKNSV